MEKRIKRNRKNRRKGYINEHKLGSSTDRRCKTRPRVEGRVSANFSPSRRVFFPSSYRKMGIGEGEAA